MPPVPEFAHPADQSPSPAGALRLRLSLKGQPVQSFRFDQDAITVGRDPYCDVYVDNPGVSRQHVRIERVGACEFRVRDLDSANGTFLNNQPIQVAALRDGDAIQLGKYSLEIEIEKERPALVVPRRPVPQASDGATVMLSPSEIRSLVSEAKAAGARPPDLKLVAAPAPRPVAPPRAARRRRGTTWLIVAAIAMLGVVAAIAIEWWRAH